jgi:hypothetical protein
VQSRSLDDPANFADEASRQDRLGESDQIGMALANVLWHGTTCINHARNALRAQSFQHRGHKAVGEVQIEQRRVERDWS